MAIPLRRFAAQCVQVAIEGGKITETSSSRVSLYEISRKWRELDDATSFSSESVDGWTEKEVAAAEVIIASLTYLERIGCKNVEQLLRDTLEHESAKLQVSCVANDDVLMMMFSHGRNNNYSYQPP